MPTIRISRHINKNYELMQAIMLMAPFLTAIISNVFDLYDNNLIVISAGLVTIYSCSLLKNGLPPIRKTSIFLLFGISIIYLITYLFYSKIMTISILDMLFYFVLASIIMLKPANNEKLLANIIIISLLAIPLAGNLFTKSNTGIYYDSISMGLSYSFLPAIIAAYLHFAYYRKRVNLIILIGYIANIYYLFKILTMGVRGPIISLLFVGMFVLLVHFDKNGIRTYKNSIKGYFAIGIIFLASMMILLNFNEIVNGLYNFFASKDINIAFLYKTQMLLDDGDVLHGRTPLIIAGLNGFLNSPIWGNGIGVFAEKANIYGMSYPHNFIIQLLYDGGLILACPVLYLLIKGVVNIFKAKELEQGYPTFVLLSCTALPRLMVSADMWKVQSFWMLLTFLIVNYNNKKQKNSIY